MPRTKKRFIVTRVIKDTRAPVRYQRSGYLVFDTANPIGNHFFVNTRYEAKAIADSRNALIQAEGDE